MARGRRSTSSANCWRNSNERARDRVSGERLPDAVSRLPPPAGPRPESLRCDCGAHPGRAPYVRKMGGAPQPPLDRLRTVTKSQAQRALRQSTADLVGALRGRSRRVRRASKGCRGASSTCCCT